MGLWTGLLLVFGLYVLTTITLLLAAKFKKNERGNLILDPDSWHFKLCHPLLIRKYSRRSVLRYVRRQDFNSDLILSPQSICLYAALFFGMLFGGWPFLILWSILKTVVYAPLLLLFGWFPIADIESMIWHDNPFAVKVGEIPLPKIRGHKVFPAYVILPIVYLAGWIYFPEFTTTVSLFALAVVILIATIFAVITVSRKLMRANPQETSLVKAWLSAKKNKICWRLELPELPSASTDEDADKI